MKRKKIMAWVHYDLDGAISYLTLKWTFPKANIEYQPTTVQQFRERFAKWISTTDIQEYDQIYIMDLGVYGDRDLIDHKNVFIIDHHEGHGEYTHAKTVIKNGYSSAGLLAYKTFKALYNIKFTKPQLHLILLGDDFDSYKLELKESSQLNVVFWDSTDKFNTFIKNFSGGFNGFSIKQQNMIKIHDAILKKLKETITVYSGNVKINSKEYTVCSTFGSKYINEMADILIRDYNADVALIVNANTNHVSYRRNPKCDVDLSKLAEELGNGAGHEYSAGSEITDKFLEFTKLLKDS
jgi:nanoRNase/pAp phosphatase (c-di-AMP/oligoRNAs hydrolase)